MALVWVNGRKITFSEKKEDKIAIVVNIYLVPNRQEPLIRTTVKPVLRDHLSNKEEVVF